MGWGTNEPIKQEHGLKSIDQAKAWLVKCMALWLLLPTSSLRKDWVFVVVQSLSRVWLFVTPWTAARQASLSFNISRSLLKLVSILLVMPSNHLVLCHSLLLLPSIFPSIRVFSNASVVLYYQVAKVLEFQLQHQSFQWTFRTDFL